MIESQVVSREMSDMRRWKTWPGRTARRLKGAPGAAVVMGVAVAVGAWKLLPDGLAGILGPGGVVLAAGGIGYAIWKATPPSMKRAEAFVGRMIPLGALDRFFPPLPKLAIIGPADSGKTTLKSRLSFRAPPGTRTPWPSAYIAAVPSTPPGYLAVLDASEETYTQQFRMAEACDFLCIVMDHNAADATIALSPSRLKEQEVFLKRIRRHLAESPAGRKQWIQILINKRDLWQKSTPDERVAFDYLCAKEAGNWKERNLAETVESHPHSNRKAKDVARFTDALAACYAQWRQSAGKTGRDEDPQPKP